MSSPYAVDVLQLFCWDPAVVMWFEGAWASLDWWLLVGGAPVNLQSPGLLCKCSAAGMCSL
jgi:hypothetical protein